MYLTKFKLDPTHPQVRQSLVNAHDLHRNLMKLFGTARKDNDILYALRCSSGCCELYLQSRILPSLGADVLSRYGMTMLFSSDYEDRLSQMRPDSVHHFVLDAMPCKAVPQQDASKHSKRQCLKDPTSRMAWLHRKGEQGGFEILDLHEYPCEQFNVLRNGVFYYMPRYRYVGQLRITNEALFQQTLAKGIGPGKTYGLGLLLVS